MTWQITIDQIAESGGRQRYGPVETEVEPLADAVAAVLAQTRLARAVAGHYQITVTDPGMSDA